METKKKKKKTLGEVSLELLRKEEKFIPHEQAEWQLEKYENEINIAINKGLKKFPNKDFYITVLTFKDRLLKNVIRNYFITRESCPTPTYDQTVYKYHYKDKKIEFLWCIPARDICLLLMDNALYLDPYEKALLKFVLDFKNGTLLKLAKKLNNEES